jgi:hypothetical protein
MSSGHSSRYWITFDLSFFVLDALKLYHSDGPGRPFYDPEAIDRSLNYIIAGKERLANNWLTACKETINASIHEVQTLSQRQVPEHDANNIIELAKEIVQDLEKAIVTPIE